MSFYRSGLVLTTTLLLLALAATPAGASACSSAEALRKFARDPDGVVFAGAVASVSVDQSRLRMTVTTWFHPAERPVTTIDVETHANCGGSFCVIGSDALIKPKGTEMVVVGRLSEAQQIVRWTCPEPEELEDGRSSLYESAVRHFGLPSTASEPSAEDASGGPAPVSIGFLLAAALASAIAIGAWFRRDRFPESDRQRQGSNEK